MVKRFRVVAAGVAEELKVQDIRKVCQEGALGGSTRKRCQEDVSKISAHKDVSGRCAREVS